LKDFIATRRAMKKAKTGDERVSLAKAGDVLRSPQRVRKLAARISKQFERESTRRDGASSGCTI
jgi:hypothetical protein